jgi:CheY-like chemotaxis protein
MLVNLLSNAVKFTPEDGRIGLEVRGDPGQGVAHFTVWDTGIGIAPEHARQLFRPFIQVDSGLARQYGGSGLGLSLVYRMAEMHGGGVSMSSVPGQGSRFTISLRWEGPGEPGGTGPLQPAHVPNLQRALVIEDSPTAADQLGRYLSELGAQVTVVPAGEPALSKAVEIHPEVILLDILLPGLSGWEVLEQLKADGRTRAIPVIVVSVVDEQARGLALGAADYAIKPITRSRLHEALWKALTPSAGTRAGTAESSSAGRPAILIAEDNPANQATYADYLSIKGYRVVLSANGAEAIERAREVRPDLILMDIQMPGMDGLEATRRLRADAGLCSTPIIALTALAMPGDRERCLAAGVDAYLTKPVSLKLLAQFIEMHLHRK